MKTPTPGLTGTQEHDHNDQDAPTDLTLRVKALESLLVENGLVNPAGLDALVDAYESKVGPRNSERVVAQLQAGHAHQVAAVLFEVAGEVGGHGAGAPRKRRKS